MSDDPDSLMTIVMISLVIFFVLGGALFYYFTKFLRHNQVQKTFGEMATHDGFQVVLPGNPTIIQLRDRIRAFDDPMLTNITIDVRVAAYKKVNDVDVYLNYYEWEKKRTYLKTHRGRQYHDTEVEFHLRTGVYLPIELGIPKMFVRGRLSPAQENEMELKHGLSTPPEKGIPDFDRIFVCKGPSSMVVSNTFTMDVQKAMLSFNGTYPLVPDEFQHLVIYLNEYGMNVTMEKAPTFEQMKSLLDFSIMLHGELLKARKHADDEEEEEIYKVPD